MWSNKATAAQLVKEYHSTVEEKLLAQMDKASRISRHQKG